MDPSATPRPPSPVELAKRKAQNEAEAAKRERQALACWNEGQPIEGTPAEAYLRGRGITCAIPDSLRFHGGCWHGGSAKRLPAMVARVDGLERLAIHRTYLRADGTGKADVTPAKAMLGKCAGGAVRTAQGQGPLVVAEGIETALSLSSGLLRGPGVVLAALSAPGVAGLSLPSAPGKLTIAPDGDKAGREAANMLAERASAQGWAVDLLPAPDGRDWNDILCTKGAAI